MTGNELEKPANEIMDQPPEVIERVKRMLGASPPHWIYR